MDVLVGIEREEKKLEKQLSKLQRQLTGVRSAADGLGHSTQREMVSVRNRVCRLLVERRLSRRRRSGGRRLEAGEEGRLLKHPRQPTGPYLFP
jgi:hypothetical protein